MTDRGYLNLLSHLSRSQTSLPLPTIQGSIAHYLAHVQPSATPLAATVVSSPFFRFSTYAKLNGLLTAFRHAVHIKVKLLKDEPGGLFVRGLSTRMVEWVTGVLNGLQGGQPLLRLASCSGLLQGLEDWEKDLKAREGRMRRKVEEELVVALAEVMDQLAPNTRTQWEKEFNHESQVQTEEGALQLTFLITSRAVSLVAQDRLKALPLPTLIQLLLSVLDDAFQQGTFLRGVIMLDSAPVGSSDAGTKNIERLSQSPLLNNIAALSAMCSQLLSVLADTRPKEAWPVMQTTLERIARITRNVESDWLKSPFVYVDHEEELDSNTREVAKTTWTILKTLLFTTIRITQSVLSIVVYVPHPGSTRSNHSRPTSPQVHSPHTFSLTVLHTLSHLSFVLSQFGGVSSTASEGGFPELKKVFYTALDILSSDELESARFVHELRESMDLAQARAKNPTNKFVQAKQAYALACAEQLVKVLNEDSIRNDVYPLCSQHLNDPSHRETYESSHSVMLAIFASHAQKSQNGPDPALEKSTSVDAHQSLAFAEQIVPFYAQCLIENSAPDKLNRVQLRLAYRALVRSASTMKDGDTFAWYCIESLLHASRSTSNPEHQHSMRLAIIATVPSVSLAVLPKLLDAIASEIISHGTLQEKEGGDDYHEELVSALFEEISERVGDEAKEFAMGWWDANKARFDAKSTARSDVLGLGKGKGKATEMVSRL